MKACKNTTRAKSSLHPKKCRLLFAGLCYNAAHISTVYLQNVIQKKYIEKENIMATWKVAVCLAALLASTTVDAKPSSPAGRNRPQQAATNAGTYCKLSALVSHDAILARLNDEKPDDTKTHLRQKYAPAAASEQARSMLDSAIDIAISKAWRVNLPADAKAVLDADTKKQIAERIGVEEYNFCMNALTSE